MRTASGFEIETDERINTDPILGPAVSAATAFFLKEVDEKPGIILSTGRLSWTLEDSSLSGKRIILSYSEPIKGTETVRRLEQRPFIDRTLQDPVERDVSVLQLLQTVLRWRLQDVNIRIANRLKELDTEEQNGLAH